MVINLGKVVPNILSEVNENSDDLVSSRGIAAALAKKLTVVNGVVKADVRFEGALEFASGYGSSMVSRKGYYIQAIQIVDSSTMLLTLGTTPRTSEEINNTGIAQTFDSGFESGFEDHIDSYVCMDVGRYCPDCARILSVDGNKLTVRPTYTFWNDDSESANYPLFTTAGKFSVSLSAPESLDVNLNYLNSVNSVGIDLDTTAWSFGERAHSIGPGSVTVGINCVTTGAGSTTLGEGIYNPFNGCLMIGRYPIRYYSPGGYDPLFVVGDGTPGSRHNAFVIRKGMMEINVDPTRIYVGDVTLAKYVTDHSSIPKTDPMTGTVSTSDDVYYEHNTSTGKFTALADNKSRMYKITVPSGYGPFAGSYNSNCGLMFMQNIDSEHRWMANRNMRVSNGYEVVYNPDTEDYFYTCSNGMFFGKVEPDGDTIAWGRYSGIANRYGVMSKGVFNGKTYLLLGRGIAAQYSGYSANINCNVEDRTASLPCRTKWFGANLNGWCSPTRKKSAIINGVVVATKDGGGLEYSANILQVFEDGGDPTAAEWSDCTIEGFASAPYPFGNIVVGKDADGNEVGIACGNGVIRFSTDGINWNACTCPNFNWTEARFAKNGSVVVTSSNGGILYANSFKGRDTVFTQVREPSSTGVGWYPPEPVIVNGSEYLITTAYEASSVPIMSADGGATWSTMFNIPAGVYMPPVLWDGNLLFAVTDGTAAIKKVPISQCIDAFSIKKALSGFDGILSENSSAAEMASAINEIRVVLKNVVSRMYK